MGGTQGDRVTRGGRGRPVHNSLCPATESHLLTTTCPRAAEKSGLEAPRSQGGGSLGHRSESAQTPLLQSREVSSKQMSSSPQKPEVRAQGTRLWGRAPWHWCPEVTPQEHLGTGPQTQTGLGSTPAPLAAQV